MLTRSVPLLFTFSVTTFSSHFFPYCVPTAATLFPSCQATIVSLASFISETKSPFHHFHLPIHVSARPIKQWTNFRPVIQLLYIIAEKRLSPYKLSNESSLFHNPIKKIVKRPFYIFYELSRMSYSGLPKLLKVFYIKFTVDGENMGRCRGQRIIGWSCRIEINTLFCPWNSRSLSRAPFPCKYCLSFIYFPAKTRVCAIHIECRYSPQSSAFSRIFSSVPLITYATYSPSSLTEYRMLSSSHISEHHRPIIVLNNSSSSKLYSWKYSSPHFWMKN